MTSHPKPFYRLVERRGDWPYYDRLVFQNDNDPTDRVEFSEWWYWRLWRRQKESGV